MEKAKLKNDEVEAKITEILKIDQVKEPEKYQHIAELVKELEREILAHREGQTQNFDTSSKELERLQKIKQIVDSEIDELSSSLEKHSKDAKDFKVRVIHLIQLFRNPTLK